VIRAGEVFDLSICNPPFHASAEEAAAGSWRKRYHLGARKPADPVLNFGGKAAELWCQGGELGFVRRMITQSAEFSRRCRWFTTIVSKSAHLPRIHQALREVRVADVKTVEMAQGQKKSRILAWTFMGS
jgi:23S rRNA (adenine1618-N6)-methyltransferase